MDYLRQIEEDLRNIGIESKLKKKYPEVADACDRALDALKSIREVYVSEIMKKNKSAKLPQSSDILAPYLLVCNYADGSAKVTLMALNGMNLLLTYDLVPPSDVKNIMRVLSIQSASKTADVQLKLLQVVLQLANSLIQKRDAVPAKSADATPEADPSDFLTESVFCGFLTLAMQLCEAGTKSNNLSVSSTALGTVRQIIAQALDGVLWIFRDQLAPKAGAWEVTVDQASSKYSLTAIMLVREMCLFVQGLPGEWIRGVNLSQVNALDLLIEILGHWKVLFQRVPFFRKLVQDSVFPALRPLLKGLQEDYVRTAVQQGIPAAVALCSRVVKLARCVLVNFVVSSCQASPTGEQAVGTTAANLNSEGAFIVSMLVHALQPDRAGPPASTVAGTAEEGSGAAGGAGAAGAAPVESTFKSRWEEASSMLMQTSAGAGIFLSRLANPSAPSAAGQGAGSMMKGGKFTLPGASGGVGGSAAGFYVTLSATGLASGGPYNSSTAAVLLGNSGAHSGATQLPTYPALCCLEALLAFLLSDLSPLLADCGAAADTPKSPAGTPVKPHAGGNSSSGATQSRPGSGIHVFESLLVSTTLAVCTFLQSALSNEANFKELETSVKAQSPLCKLLKDLLNGSFEREGAPSQPPNTQSGASSSSSSAAAAVEGMVASDSKQLKGIHEHLHSSGVTGATTAELLLLAFYVLQVVPRLLLTVSMQLGVGTGTLSAGGGQQKVLRRTNSSTNSIARRMFLSPSVAALVAPSGASAGLVGVIRAEPSRGVLVGDALGRACDSVYEACLDAWSLVLNTGTEVVLVRAGLGVIAELAVVSGLLDLPRQCDIVSSVLCKYTVPLWHAQELYHGAEGGGDGDSQSASPRGVGRRDASAVKWRHYQAFVRLSQVIHLIADAVTDWDNIVDAFEQLVDYFVSCKSAPTPVTPSAPSEKDLFLPEIEKVFGAVERFKQYSVFFSDDALVRLMTSLVALSMNHLAVHANSGQMSSSDLAGEDRDRSGSSSGADIIQVSPSPFSSAANGSAGGAGGGSGAGAGLTSSAAASVLASRVRPESSSVGLAYMTEGIRSGTISFSLQALIEITKLNAFRISTVWQMVISHLRMVASLKSAYSRAISVAATHDVILSSMRFIQQQQQQLRGTGANAGPAAGLVYLKETVPASVGGGAQASLVMSDELLFNFVLPSFETVFIGRDIHRTVLEGRDESLSTRPALSQSDLLSSLKALSSVRYSDVRSAIIDGLAQLLQNRGQIIAGGSGGGWPVILDLISSVPLSMAPAATPTGSSPVSIDPATCIYGADDGDSSPSEPAPEPSRDSARLDSEALSTLPVSTAAAATPSKSGAINGSMASLAAASVIPQYQWPLESLVSAFTCMKLIVDEFLEVLMPDCELVSAVLHGLALFGSQVKDVNISLTAVEMLWKVTDSAITFARSNQTLRLSSNAISSPHYVAVVFDIMLKKLFQLSNNGQPLIRHCAMNTLFSAMSTHAPIISAEQWQQVFGNIIFPLFERAGARSRIAMWSKEEAIAPELKKGVKMSVHHSRDTAHKQWSETRVIALRGLSRVLRTCTRLLLQESWFQVIWTDALSVCQGALQAACDEQEVSIAALDVVFTMLQIIIQSDPLGPATPAAPVEPPVQAANKRTTPKTTATPASAAPALVLSKDEVEHVEKCKHALWQLTWAAVRNTAFFTCNSVELALAIAQKLKELYKSRIDHEFRYSDNVRVLLEILVALVRPRVGLLRTSQMLAPAGASADASGSAGSYYAVPDLITQKQDRVAESQLQRAVMDLLTIIQPTDGLAQSCLLSTLAEICFSVLWVQVPVAPQTAGLLYGGEDSEPASAAIPSRASTEPDLLILGAAPDRLRKEAAEQLGLLLQLQFVQQEGSAASTARVSKLFPWATSATPFISLMIDIVVRRFVADICEGPLLVRSSLQHGPPDKWTPVHGKQPAASLASSSADATTERESEKPGGGFFASFGSIMSSFSSASAQSLQPVYPKHAPAPAASGAGAGAAIASARIAGGTLHKFTKYLTPLEARTTLADCTPSALHVSGDVTAQWRTFYLIDSDIKLLLTAVQACYSLMSCPHPEVKHQQPRAPAGSSRPGQGEGAGGASAPGPGEFVTEAVWNSLLTATACLLSPWQAAELCAKEFSLEPAGKAAASADTDASLLPAADIALLLRVSLKIIDLLRYPPAMALQWVDVLVRSCCLGLHVVGSAGADGVALGGFGDFYLVLWQQVASVLGSLLAAEQDADIAVRSRALWGAMEICKAASAAVLRSVAGSCEVPSVLLQICEDFLQLLLRSHSSRAMLSLVARVESSLEPQGGGQPEAEVDALVVRWMLSSQLQAALPAPRAAAVTASSAGAQPRKSISITLPSTVTAGASGASVGGDAASVLSEHAPGSGHLVLIIPQCLELILHASVAAQLKATAATVVRSVDMVQLTDELTALREENKALKAKNKELSGTMDRLQSANTIPF